MVVADGAIRYSDRTASRDAAHVCGAIVAQRAQDRQCLSLPAAGRHVPAGNRCSGQSHGYRQGPDRSEADSIRARNDSLNSSRSTHHAQPRSGVRTALQRGTTGPASPRRSTSRHTAAGVRRRCRPKTPDTLRGQRRTVVRRSLEPHRRHEPRRRRSSGEGIHQSASQRRFSSPNLSFRECPPGQRDAPVVRTNHSSWRRGCARGSRAPHTGHDPEILLQPVRPGPSR